MKTLTMYQSAQCILSRPERARLWWPKLLRVAALGVIGTALVGCPKAGDPLEAAPEVTWPGPPQPAVIRFEENIDSSSWAEPPRSFARFVRRVTGAADDAIRLKKPFDVTTDSRGRVFVSDGGWGRVAMLDKAGGKFAWVGAGGKGQLVQPAGLAVGPEDHLFVGDVSQSRVFEYDADQHFVKAYGGEMLGRPSGVAIAFDRNELWVTDAQNHKLHVFAIGGEYKRSIGSKGGADGQFYVPHSLAIRGDQVYVTDLMNFRVQVLDLDGNFVRKWGQNCNTMGCFSRPKGIDVDSLGNTYVVDAGFANVQVFTPDGKLGIFFGGGGHGPGQLWLPAGLHINEKDEIFVVSQYGYRVVKYKFLGLPEAPDASEPQDAAAPSEGEPAVPEESPAAPEESPAAPEESPAAPE